MTELELNVRVAGEAGQGIDTFTRLFAGAWTRLGYYAFSSNYVESRIRGGVNHAQIRVRSTPVWAQRDAMDLLVVLSQAAFGEHVPKANSSTLILYDEKNVEDTSAFAEGQQIAMPFVDIAREDGGKAVMANVVAAGAAASLLGLEASALTSLIQDHLKSPEQNVAAAARGEAYIMDQYAQFKKPPVRPPQTPVAKLAMTGNHALALGAITANCRFMAAYPMSPSTSIIEYFFHVANEMGLIPVQAESEVAAMNMVTGASYMGARAMTATSGGGFDLMLEALSFAGMAEIPLVAIDCCRPGPSTGLPTRTDQSDLDLLVHAAHGEFPRVVLAPRDGLDAFYAIQRAFNLADKYQVPALVLGDEHLSMSTFTVDETAFELERVPRVSRKPAASPSPGSYQRYAVTEDGVSPWVDPGAREIPVLASGDEHDEHGFYDESAENRVKMQDKRLRKESHILADLPPPTVTGNAEGPQVVLVGYGTSHGALAEATEILNAQGTRACLVHFTAVWPFPVEKVKPLVDPLVTMQVPVVVVEGNSTAQFRQILAQKLNLRDTRSLLRYDGRPFTVDYILTNLENQQVI